MRKSAVEKLRDAKRQKHQLVEMNTLDDLLKLLVDGERPAEERQLNPTQKAFIYSPQRLTAYKGPAGCAKTSTGVAKIMARALLSPGTKYLIARYDYNDLIDTTALRAEEMIGRLPPGTLLQRDKSPPMKWYIRPAAVRMEDGSINDEPSQITFMGLKDTLGSYEFNGAFIDEADECDEKRIHEVNTRLRHRGGNYNVSLAFNPPDVNHWLYTACTGMDARGNKIKDPWLHLFEPRPNENVRNLPDGYYEMLAAALPEDMRQRLIDGIWGATFPGDPVIRQFRRSLHVTDGLEFNPNGTLFRWWDFGYARPAVLFAQVTLAGGVRILREQLGKQQEATTFAREVKALTATHFPTARIIKDFGDPAVKQKKDTGQTLAVLMREGITVHYKQHSFDLSMRLLRSVFERLVDGRPQVQIERRQCPILISALSGGYHLKEDGVTPHKDGFYDHLVDALRYGVDNVLGTGSTFTGEVPDSVAYNPMFDR